MCRPIILFRRDALTKERPAALGVISRPTPKRSNDFTTTKPLPPKIMIKYGGTRDRDDANRVYDLFRKARVLEPMPYALKGSVDAVIERQGQELKGVDLSQDDR